jgi:hypothetical protein
MDFEFAEEISNLLAEGKLDDAILLAEIKLKEQAPTEFQKLLGKNLLHQTHNLVDYFAEFHNKVQGRLDVKAIYAEMNGFTINCDLWFLNLFAFDHVGDTKDTDWLAYWKEGNSTIENFRLTGFEELPHRRRTPSGVGVVTNVLN